MPKQLITLKGEVRKGMFFSGEKKIRIIGIKNVPRVEGECFALFEFDGVNWTLIQNLSVESEGTVNKIST